MATDGAWRWRYGVEDKYHYRFWGQVIRWMAYQRNMAVGERMRLSFRPEQPRPGETVFFRVSVMTAEGTPLRQASLPLRIEPPTGKSETLPLRQVDSEWGVFVGQRQLQQTGVHRITISHPQDDSQLETSVVVQGRAVEAVGRPARPDVIREIAAAAKGKFLAIAGGKLSGSNTSGSNTPGNTASDDETPSLAGTLVAQLNRLPDPPAEVRRIRWWSHPLTMIGMIVGLTLFWIGRKWAGMI
jgi:hypothetical protein